MNDPENRVRLLVNGESFEGWKRVQITAGINQQARSFELDVTHRWPGQKEGSRRVRPGDECQIRIGPDLVLTGYVDATPISYNASSVTFGVKGKSRTVDLVECSAINSPGEWRDRKIEQIAAELAKPYGIDVLAVVDTSEPFPCHHIQQGESVFASLQRMTSNRGLLVTDNPQGQLVLTRAGAGRAADPLVLGGNILTGSAGIAIAGRYGEYVVKGQQAGENGNLQIEERTTDGGVARPRTLVIVAEGDTDPATARKRAVWEATSRFGRGFEATYSVAGWRQANGSLWTPNSLVHVHDPIIGFEMEMLISEVTYSLSSGGSIATLKVAPKAAYELRPEVPKAKGKNGASARPGDTIKECG